MKLVNAIYSEEEQERLSKEVMVPFEEEITQDNVVTNTNENKENEEIKEKNENKEKEEQEIGEKLRSCRI